MNIFFKLVENIQNMITSWRLKLLDRNYIEYLNLFINHAVAELERLKRCKARLNKAFLHAINHNC